MNAELSPMMRQYLNIKEQNKDSILFFRLGDFYEMFFDDAKIASKELDLVLTGRDCGLEERAPMCGVPYHSYEAYLARLISRGYKVSICEQTEDASKAKGIVKREVVRTVTPGTIIEGSMLDEGRNNYFATLVVTDKSAGICFVDFSTGEIHLTEINNMDDIGLKVNNELGRFMPRELLLNKNSSKNKQIMDFIKNKMGISSEIIDNENFEYEKNRQIILNHFNIENLENINLNNKDFGVRALGAALDYIKKTQRVGLERITNIDIYSDSAFMNLDIFTRRNLELIESMRTKEKKGSLLGLLDKTKTAMGKRLIRNYIENPLVNSARIIRRQNAVEELYLNPPLRSIIIEDLSKIYDLERIMTRIVYGTGTAKELISLKQTIEKFPSIKNSLENSNSALLKSIYNDIDLLEDIHSLINRAINDNPPNTIKDGGIIKAGYNEELDDIRNNILNSKDYLAKLETDEKEKTGIKTMKIGFNKVFGYYIEITKSNIANVPDNYIRKQTLSNCERYITEELKEIETKVLGAQEKIVSVELELFEEIRKTVAKELHRIQSSAAAIAKLDVICSFADVAVKNNYCRPQILNDGKIIIKDGRHPVVESILTDNPFVPNDTYLDTKDNLAAIITGPNMAGKSTYMRQVALIVIMAQMGSFVPAKSAQISIADSIFTRVGASDDLASGQSTFMVEMNEVAHILKNATSKSLLILDEIGRGTSTFDGMSIARSVLEYVTNKKRLGAKTLFSTHYHELTELENYLPNIKNYNIAVKKRGEDIIFLRKIVAGGADDSYGIEVAKLAGIPAKVTNRAKEILKELEDKDTKKTVGIYDKKTENNKYIDKQDCEQTSIVDNISSEIIKKIQQVNIETLTPLEALNILYQLKNKISD